MKVGKYFTEDDLLKMKIDTAKYTEIFGSLYKLDMFARLYKRFFLLSIFDRTESRKANDRIEGFQMERYVKKKIKNSCEFSMRVVQSDLGRDEPTIYYKNQFLLLHEKKKFMLYYKDGKSICNIKNIREDDKKEFYHEIVNDFDMIHVLVIRGDLLWYDTYKMYGKKLIERKSRKLTGQEFSTMEMTLESFKFHKEKHYPRELFEKEMDSDKKDIPYFNFMFSKTEETLQFYDTEKHKMHTEILMANKVDRLGVFNFYNNRIYMAYTTEDMTFTIFETMVRRSSLWDCTKRANKIPKMENVLCDTPERTFEMPRFHKNVSYDIIINDMLTTSIPNGMPTLLGEDEVLGLLFYENKCYYISRNGNIVEYILTKNTMEQKGLMIDEIEIYCATILHGLILLGTDRGMFVIETFSGAIKYILFEDHLITEILYTDETLIVRRICHDTDECTIVLFDLSKIKV